MIPNISAYLYHISDICPAQMFQNNIIDNSNKFDDNKTDCSILNFIENENCNFLATTSKKETSFRMADSFLESHIELNLTKIKYIYELTHTNMNSVKLNISSNTIMGKINNIFDIWIITKLRNYNIKSCIIRSPFQKSITIENPYFKNTTDSEEEDIYFLEKDIHTYYAVDESFGLIPGMFFRCIDLDTCLIPIYYSVTDVHCTKTKCFPWNKKIETINKNKIHIYLDLCYIDLIKNNCQIFCKKNVFFEKFHLYLNANGTFYSWIDYHIIMETNKILDIGCSIKVNSEYNLCDYSYTIKNVFFDLDTSWKSFIEIIPIY